MNPNPRELKEELVSEELDFADQLATSDRSTSSSYTPSWMEATILIASGISSIWYWNTILNLSEVVNERYFENYKANISNIMTFVFEASAVLCYVVCYKMDGTSVNMQLFTAVSNNIITVITPFVLLIPNPLTRFILWIVISFLFGCWLGLQQFCHFGLAANLPSGVKTVLVSSGQGFSGIISYGLYWAVIKAGKVSPFGAMCIQMSLMIVITLIGPWGMWYIRTRPEVGEYIVRQKILLNKSIEEKGKPGIWQLLRKGRFPILNVCMTFLSSYIVFPNIGPFEWPHSDALQTERVMGCAQLGLVLGRSAPLLSPLIFSIKTTFCLNCLRFVFPVIFTVAATNTRVEAFSSYWFQCLVLFCNSTTEGWLASLGLLHSALAGETIYERAELSKFSSGALTLAITIGLGLTFALRAAVGL